MRKLSIYKALLNNSKYCTVHTNIAKRLFTENHVTEPSSRQYSSQLLHFIKQKINLNGPMTVADYMRLTASSPIGGYYSRHGSKIFGEKGDFVTAPELTQMFGELIGVWCYYELSNTGHDEEWQLVENGPGTGQLMHDITRALRQLKVTKGSIHLVETSDALLNQQESLLCEYPAQFVDGKPYIRYNVTKDGFPIYWYRNVDDIPAKFSVFISNEFLDALPINQFKRDDEGKWHEVYVNLDKDDKLCFMLSRSENLHTFGLLPKKIREDLSIKEWEISIDAGTYINQVADSITKFGGFVLIVDYGHDGTRRDLSLRAYKDHKIVHPLESPGEHDITADVNFGYLKSLVDDRTLVFGPVEQRQFLTQMGIGLRLEKLLASCRTKEEKKNLLKSCEILLSEKGMGERFKVMSIFPKTLENILNQRKGPAGFTIARTF
uniref:Protein arginine methyltransferase NDUFAF7 n=1 Tax=Elaeophora elaphi TaxID=1147741 RepID=A0A0R3RZ23_9BILA